MKPTVAASRWAVAAVVTLFVALTASKDCIVDARQSRNVPHPHKGILKPYSPGPFEIKLDAGDERELSAGRPVMKQTKPKPGQLAGSAICVQDVEAPRQAVWNQILDLDSYKGKVSKVNECKNYEVKKNRDGSSTIKTKMVLGVMPGFSLTSFYDHTLCPKKNSVTWRLDYDKTSDFDDVAGHWHVEDHPTKPGCTRLFYACDIKLAGAVPKPVVNMVSKSALKSATAWVKKNSERHPDRKVPKPFQTPAFGFAS